MKRYGIAAAFAVFIALAIGIFWGTVSMDRLPSFQLATVEGDGREGEAIWLGGYFRNGPYSERMEVSASGSAYESERSLYQRILYGSSYRMREIDQLIEAYPDFMRNAKYDSEYYQDEELLVRVSLIFSESPDGYRFQIDILDKQTKRARTFPAHLPETPSFRITDLLDVQRIGPELKVAALSYPIQENTGETAPELRIYTVGLEDGKVAGGEKTDYGAAQFPNGDIRLTGIKSPDITASNEYLALELTVMEAPKAEPVEIDEDGRANAKAVRAVRVAHQLVVYHYATGKMESAALPEDDPDALGKSDLYFAGSEVMRVNALPAEVQLNRYRIPDMALENEHRWTLEDLHAESIQQVAWGQNRLYILHPSSGQPAVTAIDPVGGNVVYRGAVSAVDAEDGQKQELLKKLHISYIGYTR